MTTALELRPALDHAELLSPTVAVARSGMEYGGITPVGLPADWALYLDARVAALPSAIVGSGIRGSKLRLPGAVLAALPGAVIIDGLAREAEVPA